MDFHLKTFENCLSVNRIANLHFFEFEKNFFTENDKHPFYELVFVAGGTLFVSAENYEGKLTRNEMIIHKPNESHSLKCLATNAPTVIIIGFTCDCKDLEEFSSRAVALDENSIKKLAEIVKEGRNVFAPPYGVPTYDMKKKKEGVLYGSEQMLKISLEYFLIDLLRKNRFSAYGNESFRQSNGFHVSEVIKYVDDNFLEKITIDELAFLFGTNRATLCKEFKKAINCTLGEYVTQKKLLLAKEEICTTAETFTEIAYHLNFETIHYFTRFFKKHTGMTPKEYRQLHAKKDGK